MNSDIKLLIGININESARHIINSDLPKLQVAIKKTSGGKITLLTELDVDSVKKQLSEIHKYINDSSSKFTTKPLKIFDVDQSLDQYKMTLDLLSARASETGQSFKDAFDIIKNSMKSAETDIHKLQKSFLLLNDIQNNLTLSNDQAAASVDYLSNKQLDLIANLNKLNKEEQKAVLNRQNMTKAAHASNNEPTYKTAIEQMGTLTDLLKIDLFDSDSASRVGIGTASAIVTTLFSSISNFSVSNEAQNAGEALGMSIGGIASGALSGAMVGSAIPVIGPVAGAIVGGLIPAFSSYIGYITRTSQTIEELISKANELTLSYRQQQKTLYEKASIAKQLVSEYSELSDGVNKNGKNVSLTADQYDRYKTICNELSELYPELISYQNDEAVSVLNLSGNIDQMNEALDKLIDKRQQSADTDFLENSGDIISAANAKVNQLDNALEQLYFKRNGVYTDEYYYDVEELGPKNPGMSKEDYEKEVEEINKQIKQVYKEYTPVIEATLRLNDDYNSFETDTQRFIDEVALNIDWGKHVDTVDKKSIDKFLKKNLIEPIADLSKEDKDEVEKAISDLFKIDLTDSARNIHDAIFGMDGVLQKLPENIRELFDDELLREIGLDFNIDGTLENINNSLSTATDDIEKQIVAARTRWQLAKADRLANEDDLENEYFSLLHEKDSFNVGEILAKNLNNDELRVAQRLFAEIGEESTDVAKKMVDSINTIFSTDNEDLIANVRTIQTELSEGKISFAEYQDNLEKLGVTFDSTDAYETFLQIFNKVAPTVKDGVNDTINQINTLSNSFDMLEKSIEKLKSGEALSRNEILELIEKFPELIDQLDYDADTGAMVLPVDALRDQQDQLSEIYRIAVEDRKTSLEQELNDLKQKNKAKIDDYEAHLADIERIKGEMDRLDVLGQVDISNSAPKSDPIVGFQESLSSLISGFSSISRAYDEFRESGYAAQDSLSGMQTVFGELDGFEEFNRVVCSATSSTEEIQQSFNNLVGEYIDSSKVLKNVTEDTKDWTITQLNAIGVTNAHIIVEEALADNFAVTSNQVRATSLVLEALTSANQDAAESAWETVKALFDEADMTETAKKQLIDLIATETIFGNSSLDTSQQVEQLNSLARAAFGVNNVIKDVTVPKHIPMGSVGDYIIEYYKNLPSIDDQWEAFLKGQKKSVYTPPSNTLPKSNSYGKPDDNPNGKSDFKKEYDNIVTLSKRFDEQIKKEETKLTDDTDYGIKNKAYSNIDRLLEKKINVLASGADHYKKEFDKIFNGLSKSEQETLNRIVNGSIHIEEIKNEDLAKMFDEALRMWNSYEDFQYQKLTEEQKRRDNNRRSILNQVGKQDFSLDKTRSKSQVRQDKMQEKENSGRLVGKRDYNALIKLGDTEKKQLNDKLKTLTQLQKTYPKNSKGYEDTAKQITSVKSELQGVVNKQLEWNEAKRQMPIIKNEWRTEQSNVRSAKQQASMDLRLETGGIINKKDYNALIRESTKRQNSNVKLAKNLDKSLNADLKSGAVKKNSEVYKQRKNEVDALNASVLEEIALQAQLRKQTSELPILKNNSRLDALSRIQSDNDAIKARRDAAGQFDFSADKTYYEDSIKTGNEMIKVHEANIKEWTKQLQKVQVGSEEYKRLVGEIENARDAIKQCELNHVEWSKAARDTFYDETTNTLNKIRNELEKQRKALEDERKKIEIAVSTASSYIDDEIKALETENKALEKNITLQKAKEAIEKARSQKNKRVYVEGVGFTWRSDENAVSQAQQAYDDLKKQHDLEAQIEHLRSIQQELQNIVDAPEKAKNESITSTLFGQNWKQDLVDGRFEFEKFSRSYQEIFNQLDEDVPNSIANQIKMVTDSMEVLSEAVDDTRIDADKFKEFTELPFDKKSDWITNYTNNALTELGKLQDEYEKAANAQSKVSSSPDYENIASKNPMVSSISGSLKKGDVNSDVITLQSALRALKYSVSINGTFDDKTVTALKKFQKDNKINETGTLNNTTKKKFKAKGYSGGTSFVPAFGIYEVDENSKEEIIVRTSSNGRLTTLEKGDGVIPANQTEKLMNLADAIDGNPKYSKLELSDIMNTGIDSSKFHETMGVVSAIQQMQNNVLESVGKSIGFAFGNARTQTLQTPSIQIGDIHINNPVGDTNSLSRAIVNELPMKIIQEIHKR